MGGGGGAGSAGGGGAQRGPLSLAGRSGRADVAGVAAPAGASAGGLGSGVVPSVRGAGGSACGGHIEPASEVSAVGSVGACVHCRKNCALVRSGFVHQHGPRGKPCPGSGQLPVQGSRRPALPRVGPRDASPSTSDGNLSSSSQDQFESFQAPRSPAVDAVTVADHPPRSGADFEAYPPWCESRGCQYAARAPSLG